MKKLLGRLGIGFLAMVFLFTSSCVWTRIDEVLIKRRTYQEFKPKQYVEPTKYLSAGGVNYAYIEKGTGPTVILLHGGVFTYNILDSFAFNPYWDIFSVVTLNWLIPARTQSLAHFGAVSTSDTWQFNFEEFAKKFHVIALDLPGFGNSSKPDIRYYMPDMTRLLNQFIEAKGLDKVNLVGHDFSGLLAMDYALTYPDKITSLVLISPYGAISHRFWYPIELGYHYPRWISRHLYRNKAARVDIYRKILDNHGKQTYLKLFYMPDSKLIDRTSTKEKEHRLISTNNEQTKKWVDQVIAYKFDSNWMKTRDFTNELYATHYALQDVKRKDDWGIISFKDDKRTDWITRMAQIKAPTFIIHGAFDPIMTSEDATYMDKAIPKSILSTYESSAHYPMIEQSDKFNREVSIFIQGVNEAPKTGDVAPAATEGKPTK